MTAVTKSGTEESIIQLKPGRAAYLERRRATTRASILLAARQVFADASYSEAKIDNIIRAAGVSRATFYAHFESKFELACAIYDEIAPQTTALFARLPSLARKDRAGIRQWLNDFVGIHLEHRNVTSLIAQLQLFERSFRARILSDAEALIDLVAAVEGTGFADAKGPSDGARRTRARIRLLFNRVAMVCAEVARGELSPDDAGISLELVGEEIALFLHE
ncbi:TetR/AcrR family transcriptional regulator [Sphingobium estronivorans]|uniref:TetR/AcrR family transcriptional regulator n=1 Tax=Sphingobium estronivorans TaxID=1577690 RepID=UPI001239A121|nr:TetR/AcrR family transcriptional regulator [Sphingobium estronivorans]